MARSIVRFHKSWSIHDDGVYMTDDFLELENRKENQIYIEGREIISGEKRVRGGAFLAKHMHILCAFFT
jgi:hypothetical protein